MITDYNLIANDSIGDIMNAENKKQLNVRIPVELYEKIEKGDKPKVELVSEALDLYFKKAIKKDSNIINNDSMELSFSNESDFHNWFADNYTLFGFNRIIKQSINSYPDFILEKDGKEIRVELETLASNFEKHNHDPSLVDVVVCLKKDIELPVDTLELPFKFDSKISTINLRIDDELEAKLDGLRGDKSKSDFYREIITDYLNRPSVPVSNTTGYIHSLEQQISMLKDQVTDLRNSNGKLMSLLNQEQALHLQTQRMLPAPEKNWWKFWK